MANNSGSIKVARISDVPVYLHWSVPIAGIVVSVYIGFEPIEAVYYCISCAILILIHEVGHLVAAKTQNLEVHEVQLSGAGGACYCESPQTVKSALILYSGGLLAQALTFIIAVVFAVLLGGPEHGFLHCLLVTLIHVNLLMFVANIVPSKEPGELYTDGYYIWAIIRGEFSV